MSAIPYSISTHLSGQLKLPTEFYRTAFEVLLQHSGLDFVLSAGISSDNLRCGSVEPVTAYAVLKHVVLRTLQFGKAFEFVRSGDVIKGNPSSAIASIHLSDTSIRRVLNGFSPPYSDYLVKLKFAVKGRPIITPLLGLNLPGILKLALVWWDASLNEERVMKDILEDRPNRKPSNLMLRGRCLLEKLVEASEPWKPAFQFLVDHHSQAIDVHDLEGFIDRWKKRFPRDRENAACQCFGIEIKDCNKVRELRRAYLEELEE